MSAKTTASIPANFAKW